jgi:hypothetical protein
MRGTKKTRSWAAAGALAAALMFLSIAGCATTGSSGGSQALTLQQVDGSAFGDRQFNAMGLKTFGPYAQQLYGYVLYGDGVTVSASGQLTGTPVGKMTLSDVQADYRRMIRETMMPLGGGDLFLRQILRNGQVVGYTATMPALNPTVWDMDPYAPASNVVLQVTFP